MAGVPGSRNRVEGPERFSGPCTECAHSAASCKLPSGEPGDDHALVVQRRARDREAVLPALCLYRPYRLARCADPTQRLRHRAARERSSPRRSRRRGSANRNKPSRSFFPNATDKPTVACRSRRRLQTRHPHRLRQTSPHLLRWAEPRRKTAVQLQSLASASATQLLAFPHWSN